MHSTDIWLGIYAMLGASICWYLSKISATLREHSIYMNQHLEISKQNAGVIQRAAEKKNQLQSHLEKF